MVHRLQQECSTLNAYVVLAAFIITSCAHSGALYLWVSAYDSTETIATRIPTPAGYGRMPVKPESFAEWLRYLPTKPGFSPVSLYNGGMKQNQGAHHLILDIDVDEKDLQQCADAVIRLRGEYLYALGRNDDIAFRFTSGHRASFRKWIEGYRAVVDRDDVGWVKFTEADSSYANFKKYLERIFMYAGSSSLAKELRPVVNPSEMAIGDVFVEGGCPGHAVIVVDMAENARTGNRVFLLAQSYMPAQDVHILRNPHNDDLSPWYHVAFGDSLVTPEWVFEAEHLKRFE